MTQKFQHILNPLFPIQDSRTHQEHYAMHQRRLYLLFERPTYLRSFIPSSTRLWNTLPEQVRANSSYATFKKYLIEKLTAPSPPSYFFLGTKTGNSLHTKLRLKGSMPPCIEHMELLACMQRADFFWTYPMLQTPWKPPKFPTFRCPQYEICPTGYRRAPNIISHHYKQQLSAKASLVPKARPIRFR